jgi:hypothetical protein
MARSWIVAGLLFAVAASLALSLVQFQTDRIVTFANHTDSRTVQGNPIFRTYESIADATCLGPTACKVIASAEIRGLFPRNGVPFWIAVCGGIVAPFLIACIGGFLVLRTLGQQVGRVVAGILLLAGAILLFPLGIILVLKLDSNALPALAHEQVEIPQLVLFVSMGLALLTGGTHLLMRAHRRGS